MSTRITLTPLKVGGKFPATWRGTFSGHPTAEEVHDKQVKVQKLMRSDLRNQVRTGKSSPGFLLDFSWQRTSSDPTEFKLEVTTKRDRRHRDGKGDDGSPTDPSPKSPPPPPM